MSASIYWAPHADRSSLYTLAPQQFLKSLGELGITDEASNEHLPALKAMAHVHGAEPGKNPYLQLAEAIEMHGAVRLIVEY